MLAECIGAEASIALLEQRPDAIALAMKALAACRSLPKIPPALELRILNGLAVAQCRYGQFEEAPKTFEEAIELADPGVDMRRLGKLLDCAGIACRELGRMEQAVNYCSRAVALFEAIKDSRSLAVAENDLGWALLGCGDLPGARHHLQRSLQLHEQGNLTTDRSAVLSCLCELCIAEGDLEKATEYAEILKRRGDLQVALEHMKAAVWITTSGGIPRGATSVHEPALLDVGTAVAEAGPRIDPE